MNDPLVSVIIPSYNSAKYLTQAIGSALMQGVEVEVIVIDDGSSDGIDEVMERYSEADGIYYVKNETNSGVAKSRNRGVGLARGKYIAFLDADDIWTEGKLKKQLAAIEKCGAVLCSTARELILPDGSSTGKIIPVKSEITYKDLLKNNSINCSSVLIKREVALEFPMRCDDSHEDYIMWLEVLKKYGTACGVNEPLLKYRLSSKGKSGSKLKSAKMTFKVYRYIGLSFPEALYCFCCYALNGVKKYFFRGR